jgi:hypothetical protein
MSLQSELSLDCFLTPSHDFDTASTGIQETESLRMKATNRRRVTYASVLTKGVYVLYKLLEAKTPTAQGTSLIQLDGRRKLQAWIRVRLPMGSNSSRLSLDQHSSPPRQQHVSYRDIV